MGISGGGVKRDLNAIGFDVRQQSIDTLSRGFDAEFAGFFQAVRGGVDAHHPHGFEHRAALQLGQQVGANVARPDQGTFDFFHTHSH
jgi:hypothetical protein